MVLTERRNKLFLIGNGFDLAHMLPTRYIEFISWYLKDSMERASNDARGNYSDDCISVSVNKHRFYYPQDLERFINECCENGKFWEYLIIKPKGFVITSSSRDRRDTDWFMKIEPKNEFCSNLLSNCREADWSGIEYEINRIMLKEHAALVDNRTKILVDRKGNQAYQKALVNIQELNKSVYSLKSSLIEYLQLNNNPTISKLTLISDTDKVKWGEIYKTSGLRTMRGSKLYIGNPNDIERHVLFLNFNYTTYFQSQIVEEFKKDFKDEFTTFDTIYIHGDLDESIDNIVFGVGDENKEIYSEIESLYDDDWLEPLKSFHYFRNQKYQQLLGFIAKGEYEVYVIGHSCSTTDRTLLNMLFEHDSCKKIHVYHYSGINSYLTTAYNIARNFNDKVRLRKVLQPFNPNLSTK